MSFDDGVRRPVPRFGKRIRNVGRMAHIVNVFARHGLLSLVESAGLKSWLTPEQFKKVKSIAREGKSSAVQSENEIYGLPARLRTCFEELGPAFVKLGQMLATREDIVSEPFLEEFRKLYSTVSPLPYSEIRDILNRELGRDRLAEFESINEKPLAAGSIAQVHEGKLKSGEVVVIKVQRPGIAHQIETDLSIIEELAVLVEKYIPELRFARPAVMVAEFKRATLGELDFVREAGNIEKFRQNFISVDFVEVPKIYWSFTTTKIITMEKFSGVAILDLPVLDEQGVDRKLLTKHGVKVFQKMAFIDGFVHGDLHPGNMIYISESSKVGLFDFGVTLHLSKSIRDNLIGLFIAINASDFERVVSHFIEIADPPINFDAASFEHEIANVLSPLIGLKLEGLNSSKIFWDLAKIAARHRAPFPMEMVVFIRTYVSFEHIGRTLDPEFDIGDSLKDFATEYAESTFQAETIKSQGLLIMRDVAQLAKQAPYQMRRLIRGALDGDLQLKVHSQELEKLAAAMDRSSSRMSISLIIASLIIGSSIITFARIGRELYSLSVFGLSGFAIAGILAFFVIISILRGNR